MESRQQVRKRQHTSDSCRTCRLRRVKCDATRPECRKCRKAGRVCGGYAIWELAVPDRSVQSPFQARLPWRHDGIASPTEFNHESTPPGATAYLSPPASQEDPDSSDSFDDHGEHESGNINPYLFMRQVSMAADPEAHAAFGHFIEIDMKQHIWNANAPTSVSTVFHYSMQKAANDPMWYSAVAAIGAAGRSLRRGLITTFQRSFDMEQYDRARAFQNRALLMSQAFRSRLTQASELEPLLMFLMAMLAHESISQNYTAVARILALAKAILAEYAVWTDLARRQSNALNVIMGGGLSATQDQTLAARLTPAIASRACSVAATAFPLLSNITQDFTSLDDASSALEQLLTETREIELELTRKSQALLQEVLRHGRLPPLPEPVLEYEQCLADCLSRVVVLDANTEMRLKMTLEAVIAWRAAFERYLQVSLRSEHGSVVLLLHLQCFIAKIGLTNCRQTEEQTCDNLNAEFAWATGLAETYVRSREALERASRGPRPASERSRSTVLDIGAVKAMYIICVKCREPAIRHRAVLALRQARRHEHSFDSDTYAKYAAAISNLERSRAGTGIPAEAILFPGLATNRMPEHARFCDVVVSSRNLPPRTFSLVCGRFVNEELDARPIELCRYTMDPGKPEGWLTSGSITINWKDFVVKSVVPSLLRI